MKNNKILQNAEQGVFMKHKNLISMAALSILLISAVVLVTGCPTGTTPSKDKDSTQNNVETPPNVNNSNNGNSSSGGNTGNTNPIPGEQPPVVNTDESELMGILGKIDLDKALITAAGSISISNLTPEAEVTSNNRELIEYQSSGNLNVKKLPDETTEVKITITLTKNGTSKSREFTVKVFKSGETPSEQDYLAALDISTTVSEDFDLPAALKNTENTQITWLTENEKIIRIENTGTNQKAVVIPDLIAQKVKLTAKVTTSPEKTKVFEITVLPVVKIEEDEYGYKKVYEFTPGKITIKIFKEEKLYLGTLYSYTIDNSDPKKITMTNTSRFNMDLSNEWLTIESLYNAEMLHRFNYSRTKLEKAEKILKKTIVTLQDIKDEFLQDFHFTTPNPDDATIFSYVMEEVEQDITYQNFQTFEDSKKTEILKEFAKIIKQEQIKIHRLPKNASLEEMLVMLRDNLKKEAAQKIKEVKAPCTYIYSISKYWEGKLHFKFRQAYDSSKPWYENDGNWSYHPPFSPHELSWISRVKARKNPDGQIQIFLSMQDASNSTDYEGTITENGSIYTFNGRIHGILDGQITATITDNKDGTIKVTVTEGGSASSRLKFEGNSLLIWR